MAPQLACKTCMAILHAESAHEHVMGHESSDFLKMPVQGARLQLPLIVLSSGKGPNAAQAYGDDHKHDVADLQLGVRSVVAGRGLSLRCDS